MNRTRSNVVAIMQPSFFPWRGYVDLISKVDTFIVLNDVQWRRSHWFNRNKIDLHGKAHWITVPVKSKGNYSSRICDMRIAQDVNWKPQMLKSLSHAYGKSPYFQLYFPEVERLIDKEWKHIADLAESTLLFYAAQFSLNAKFIRSSDFKLGSMPPVERLINLIKAVSGTAYLAPQGSKGYIEDLTDFERSGIQFDWIKYDYPSYVKNIGCQSDELSALDLLFKFGPKSGKYIW